MNGATSRSRVMPSCHAEKMIGSLLVHSSAYQRSDHTQSILHRCSSTWCTLNKTTRLKIRHYRQIYVDSPDPIVFLSITVSTSGHVYEDFTRILFLHSYREVSILAGELPEESEQFRFLRASCLANLKGSVGLILFVYTVFHTFTSLFGSRRVPSLLNQSLVLIPQQSG